MPSGGPGDHWQTDLLTWELPAFGEPIDGLLVEVIGLGGAAVLDAPPWGESLWELWTHPGRSEREDDRLTALVERLTDLRDQLRRDARERGWEIG